MAAGMDTQMKMSAWTKDRGDRSVGVIEAKPCSLSALISCVVEGFVQPVYRSGAFVTQCAIMDSITGGGGNKLASAAGFDPEALERGAKALKEINKSPVARQVIQSI